MADYWDMMATQESGLDSQALDDWEGEAFNYAGTLTNLGKDLNVSGGDRSLALDATATKNAGMLMTPNGVTTEMDNPASFVGKMFEPVKNAMATTDTFLRSIMGDKTMSMVYGSAIMAGAQGILQYLNAEKTQKYQTQTLQAKYAEDAKVRQEGYAREDDARARKGVVANQNKVAPNTKATAAFQAPGYAVSKQYDDIAKQNRYGLLGS